MIYVDDMNYPYGRMIMNHVISDSGIDELNQMADKIGVKRKWIQKAGTHQEHYDICLSAKKKAIENGAKEISYMDLGRMISNLKQIRGSEPKASDTAQKENLAGNQTKESST